MSARRCVILALGLGWGGATTQAADWDQAADYLGDELSFVSEDGIRTLRVSGRLDFTGYYVPEPSADLLYTGPDAEVLFSPVVRLFADARVAPKVQARMQVRADRGFDPADERMEARVEEGFLRFAVWPKHRVSVRAGRFATVFGSWARRHLEWDYPFITAPLAQENLTGLWDEKGVPNATTLEKWTHVRPVGDAAAVVADERQRIPVMWGPVYGTGVALAVGGERWDAAVEVKNTGLSSRPDTWDDLGEEVWQAPAYAARLGWRPTTPWDVGVSLAHGSYLRPEPTEVAVGRSRADYRQTTLGHDVGYAWRYFQFWGEVIASRFEVPGLGEADTVTYALEAKYRFTPQWAGFARWSQQFFMPIEGPGGVDTEWGRDAWRVEAGAAFRFAAHAQVKVQGGLRHERPSREELIPSAAVQLSLRF